MPNHDMLNIAMALQWTVSYVEESVYQSVSLDDEQPQSCELLGWV